jgi:hypothetical protein
MSLNPRVSRVDFIPNKVIDEVSLEENFICIYDIVFLEQQTIFHDNELRNYFSQKKKKI